MTRSSKGRKERRAKGENTQGRKFIDVRLELPDVAIAFNAICLLEGVTEPYELTENEKQAAAICRQKLQMVLDKEGVGVREGWKGKLN